MTMLSEMANHHNPQRGNTTVDTPRHRPTAAPHPSTTARLDRARVNAGRITGGPGLAMAKAKTAFRKKHAAVIAATASTSGITTGPCTTWIPSAGQAVTRWSTRCHRPYPGFVPGRVARPPGALV